MTRAICNRSEASRVGERVADHVRHDARSGWRTKLGRMLAAFGLRPLERLASHDDLPAELRAYLFSEADYEYPYHATTEEEDEEDVPTE